jgi:hypothetical protein
MRNEVNPVVLQVSGRWHVVEHSRRSKTSLCGQKITHRGAHARLSLVGERNTCPKCLKLFKEMNPPGESDFDLRS